MPPPTNPQAMSEYPDPLSFSLLNWLRRRTDGNGYPCPDINNTRSLISRLTSKLRVDEPKPSSATRTSSEFPDTLVYPDPTPDPDVKPKVESIDSLAPSQSEPPTTVDPGNLQMPEASVLPEHGTHPRGWRGGRSRGVRGHGRGRQDRESNP
ncbi:hypothetical protein Moror_10114 [Moniliophthora roreri MCA 2997]|uniref:Uncharacterized protein n=1 Tax=Moniliophthora roreri (strain MCA 2997) TaxID=1381753 RepID=V2WY57_MONRO|nr:hypothetical protein Moror_10114 [Moniliophthora roreri MCA 2997]